MPSQKMPARLLLIEDHDEVRRSLTLMLRSNGYAVDSYRSGIELLSTRELPSADCALIDYKMPVVDGLELLRRLRVKGLSIPALMITGVASTTLKERAREAGFSGVLLKPLKPRELIAHLEIFLQT
jgi:CheY-like chemotaxis protein